VVYDSDPEAEWEEARHKARASLTALGGRTGVSWRGKKRGARSGPS
jgi:anthranilate/para-aminobenzoate synthase component I